jgi:hypothetical protein
MKLQNLLTSVCLLVLLTHCSDQEFNDPNAASEESASVQFLVTGIEAGMRTDHAIYLRVVAVFARDNYYMEPSDPRYTGELLRGPIDANGFLLTRPWSARYNIVKDCNILLQRAEETSIATDRAAIEGFARTMYAYQLLLNLNLTDSNGIRLDNQVGAIVSKTEALSAIAAMLDQGNTALGSAGTSFPFNLSSGFAGFDTPATFAQFNRGLKARVAMYQNDAATCLAALSASFLDAGGSMERGVYHVYSSASGDQLNPIYENPSADFVKFVAHPSFAAEAEAGDSRFTAKSSARTAQTFDGLTSDRGVTVSASSTAPFPILRNEELLLLRAEARIAQGDLVGAEGDLNAIRSKAGLGPTSLSSQSQAIDQLLHERRYSLFCEGHRWIDLRRYNRLGSLPLDREGDHIIERMPIPTNEE